MRAALRRLGEDTRHFVEDTRIRVRRSGRTALFRALRLTFAAVCSYVVALSFSPEGVLPLLAPLTALLVVQVTLASTLASSVERVVSVVVGVLLAVVFSGVVGLTWWSLGLLIAISILLGTILRLGPNILEVPISAMLVLGVGIGGTEFAALDRIGETVVGAIVGALVNIAFPPAVRSLDAGQSVEQFAHRLADLLGGMAHELAAGPTPEQAHAWLEEARGLSRRAVRLDTAVQRAVESRKLNVRAIGTAEPGPSLADGLEALEHTAVAVRNMVRTITDAIAARPPGAERDEYATDVDRAFATLLEDLAIATRSFGRLVRAEMEGDAEREERELAKSLEALREARARVSDLLLTDVADRRDYWELNVWVLTTVERVLRELDVEEHVRMQARRRLAAEEHSRRRAAAARLRAAAEQLADLADVSDAFRRPDFPDHPFDHPTDDHRLPDRLGRPLDDH